MERINIRRFYSHNDTNQYANAERAKFAPFTPFIQLTYSHSVQLRNNKSDELRQFMSCHFLDILIIFSAFNIKRKRLSLKLKIKIHYVKRR